MILQRRNDIQQQPQQQLEIDREATATELASSPQQEQQQQQGSTIEDDNGSIDGRSTPTLEASDTPLIANNASLRADTGIFQQPHLQEVAAVGAGTHLSKFNSGSWLLFCF